MRRIENSTAFRRDVKLSQRRGKDDAVVASLLVGEPLAAKHRDHALTGSWKGFRDCHVEPDWVLIYQVDADLLKLVRLGKHSDFLE